MNDGNAGNQCGNAGIKVGCEESGWECGESGLQREEWGWECGDYN